MKSYIFKLLSKINF